MTTVRLGQLFDCTEGGGTLIAESADGALLHIDDVPSGLACSCFCVGCERPMVAKKGAIQVHHFAHHSARDGSSCPSAGETALHKFAKKVLDQRLEIALPELYVSSDDDRELVVSAMTLKFDRATLELRSGPIVPDVVLELFDRRLLVEFKVTHSCDEAKIEYIRALDVGAIEIDLSQYRDRPLDEIGNDILYNAPRAWLHNPRQSEALARLEQRGQQRHAEFKREIARLYMNYHHPLPASEPGNGTCETTIRRNGLGEVINLKVDGAGCFLVRVAEWQAAVVLDLIKSRQPFRTRDGLAGLARRGWLSLRFASLRDDQVQALKDTGLPFEPPVRAVELYLKQLEKLGLIHSGRTETWKPAKLLWSRLQAAKELRERPARRRAQIETIVKEQIRDLPESETSSFNFDVWIASTLPGRQGSVADSIRGEEAAWTALCRDISHIRTDIRFSPRSDLQLYGLPCAGELDRMLKQKTDEAEQRERSRREKEQAEADARLTKLHTRALRDIGDLTMTWLNTGHPALNGLSPLEAASSATGFDAAIDALNRKTRELALEKRALQRKQKAVAELEELALSRYYDPELAALWMRSSRTELGGNSPSEFTCDDATRDRCAYYLPKKRSRR
ncbi:hypothetical protein ABIE85_001129 [Bradyrhizobium diazoefficiens]|uniref:competence protein CoiA family protein n=1 Tax=Bradyrhizobium diazoefficiens TaxID=1355477 RepID=UPI0035148A01